MQRRLLVCPQHKLSIRQQCMLLSICRASFYYSPKQENADNLQMMQLMDAHILEEPTAGVLTMQSMLEEKGYKAGYERIRRLMRLANIRPIYPRKHLTQMGDGQYIYPYLLRNLKVERVNQVWAIDITYVPMAKGFMYLTAVIDVYSRYIVGWGLSKKYQHIYLNPADDGSTLYQGISCWIEKYNHKPHQGINRNKPSNLYQRAA